MKTIYLCVVNLLCIVLVQGSSENSKVYTKDNFNDEIVKNNHFVMFFAPWCSYCKRLHPTWEELAEMLNAGDESQVTIAKVDCTKDTELCTEHDITGYPTLLFFLKGKTTGIKFKGTRDLPALTTFMNVLLGSDREVNAEDEEEVDAIVKQVGLIELTAKTFDKHVETGNHFIEFYAPWCGHCQKLAPTWDALAKSFETEASVSIAKVDCTQHRPICQSYEVKSYPTLLWIQNGKKVDAYKGSRSLEDLKEYVESKLSTLKDNVSESDELEAAASETVTEPEEPIAEPVVSEQAGATIDLTELNFEAGIKSGFSLVKFYAPWCGHCKRLAPTWEELAKKEFSNQKVKIAKVDCTLDVNRELCNEQEVDGFPTIFLYRDGKKLSEYNGSRTLDDLYEFISGHFHDEL